MVIFAIALVVAVEYVLERYCVDKKINVAKSFALGFLIGGFVFFILHLLFGIVLGFENLNADRWYFLIVIGVCLSIGGRCAFYVFANSEWE